ncbi:hypothetical protein MTO96_021118 [Rhipicephalus appendiculatus]
MYTLQGHAAAPSTCKGDQHSGGQPVGIDSKSIPSDVVLSTAESVSSGTPPPSYPEVMPTASTFGPFTKEEATHVASNLGHFRQLQRNRVPVLQSGRTHGMKEESSPKRCLPSSTCG